MKIILALAVVLQVFISNADGYNYKEVVQKSLLFYEAQRSGKLPSDQRVTWRKDSALHDKGANGEDLTGGYYDAGDFVKFGFQMSFTATILAWGLLDHQKGYEAAGSLSEGRKALKWALDYFLKAHVSENVFYAQAGSGVLDHNYWGRPEDMTEARPTYMINTTHPGSDLAAETAAALAASYLVFKDVNSTYANILLSHAKQLYSFAYKYRGKYSDAFDDIRCCYNSSGYEDELVWGAAWLYRATGDKTYLTYAENEYSTIQYYIGFSWDQKAGGADVLLAKLTGDRKYLTKMKNYCDQMITSQQRTPKGLIFISPWGSLSSTAYVMQVCLETAALGVNAVKYRAEAKKQIDYMLGDTGFSYVVGFGSKYPTHCHHRAASCPDAPAKCDWTQFSTAEPNPHVLTGALVGGPGANDDYTDLRSDYVHNEVATYYNSGFQTVLAALIELGYSSE
ncbi:endoglucanase E-4-like isoform X2 [Bacillus rossius redtenbacheri]|uniref:endoglucanase E-4-like isoform X2 n=1 Tax=Bacillus rossius redtenbacheri TaxID=93214 RepID=UPI002FDEE57B